jgi:ribosomal protein L33
MAVTRLAPMALAPKLECRAAVMPLINSRLKRSKVALVHFCPHPKKVRIKVRHKEAAMLVLPPSQFTRRTVR